MRNKLIKLFVSFLAIILISCTSEEIKRVALVSDVYVSGSKASHASYWKNNILLSLTDVGFSSSSADTLIVKNNDIHVLGNGFIGGNVKTLYWKNNVLTNLTDTFSTSTEIATICSMEVDNNNDVYFAGISQNVSVTPNTYDLVYWKNGVKYIVDSFTTEPVNLICIKVNNSNIYLTSYGAYYVNGTSYSSTDFIWGVNSSSTDVYLYGRSYVSSVWGSPFYKSITTNVQTNLPSNYVPIYKMCFDNGDVYAVNKLNVYKNGVILYTTPNNSGIESFDFKNNSLYLLNSQANSTINPSQIILKDGITLMQSTSDEIFTSLFVD